MRPPKCRLASKLKRCVTESQHSRDLVGARDLLPSSRNMAGFATQVSFATIAFRCSRKALRPALLVERQAARASSR